MQPRSWTASGARVALVHDFLLDFRGAERVFAAMCELFPEADLFTAVYDEDGTGGRFAHRTVHASFLQRVHPTRRSFRTLLPLYPMAIEGLDLRGYDLVISSSSAWAHGVQVDPDAVHVCYCHNPFRYAWDMRHASLEGRTPGARLALQTVMRRWRQWDWVAAQRVDRYVANSQTTRKRVARCFGRTSEVVHPPVEVERFAPGPVGDHHLVLSALMRHKRIDVAVEAFTQLDRPLVVVGDGPDARRLRRLAGPSVTFAGRAPDAEVERLLSGARALVVPWREEFGIAAVEAQAAGRPVLGLRGGGLAETVVPGVTGGFFEAATPQAVIDAVEHFDALAVDPQACVANARRFSRAAFADGLLREVEAAIAEKAPGRDPAPRRRVPVRSRGHAQPVG
jgi:glycosyltransferase involved in cell wall biosynthesis